MPIELVVLALRLALIIAIYGFLVVLAREIQRDWQRRSGGSRASFGLVVASSGTADVPVGHVFELARLSTIGRHPDATVTLSDEHVSARHAEISRSANGAWLLRDVGSTNGTELNGTAITDPVAVRPGDLIGLGTVTLRLEPLER
jgi:hypothetical protein